MYLLLMAWSRVMATKKQVILNNSATHWEKRKLPNPNWEGPRIINTKQLKDEKEDLTRWL